MKRIEFFVEFIALCTKYGFCIDSNDPYVGIDIVDYDDNNRSWYLSYLSDLCTLKLDV